jgi:uncharacterized protein (DUF697 family)
MAVQKTTEKASEKVQQNTAAAVDSEQNEETTATACCSTEEGSPCKIIKTHIIASMGVGLIPVPMLDLVGITGVQLNMLRKLAALYEVPFTEHKVKSILASLVGGAVPFPLAGTLLSFGKTIPVAGSIIGAVILPVTAGASTFAVGKVFNQHFASGGTFLTFDPEKVRAYYAEMFEQGKTVASGMRKDAS